MIKRLSLSEKRVQKILRKREQILDTIHVRMEYLGKDIINTDDILRAVTLRSKALSDMPKSRGNHKDISDEYEKYEKLLSQRDKEYAIAIRHLIETEEQIERVWICFNTLDDDEFTILDKIYVKNQLYAAVEKESGLTHPVFEKTRKRAIETIIRLYNSDFENEFIFELSEKNKLEQEKKMSHIKNHNLEQVSIFDLISNSEIKKGEEI